MVSSKTGETGYELRRQIGDLRAFYFIYLSDGTFMTELLECFTLARNGNVALPNFVRVREQLFSEHPIGGVSKLIVQAAIGFCLGAESRIITGIEFGSRDDVEQTIKVMRIAFDTARELAADMNDSAAYQTLTFLAGALTNHLANTALKKPKTVTFNVNVSYPALALSQRVYYDADRWEELVSENRIVNPAFCPKEVRGLSS
jgi:hypothetical protein